MMDEAARQQFLEALRSDDDFRATVRRELLTQELLDLPQTVSTLIDHYAEMQASFLTLVREVGDLAGQVEALARQQAVLQGAMTSLSEMVAVVLTRVRERLDDLEVAVGGLRSDVAGVKSEMGGLRSEIGELRTDMAAGFTAFGSRFNRLESAIAELCAGS